MPGNLREVMLMTIVFFIAAFTFNGKQAQATEVSMPCGGMTLDSAAEILGEKAESVNYSYSEELKTCSYSVTLFTSIRYSVYSETDPSTAQSEMAAVVDGLKVLVPCNAVDNLGDAAMYCSGDTAERLLVRKGKSWIDIRTPKGLEAMTRVARQVLQ